MVATDSGAAAELVEDGVSGRLVSPGPEEVQLLADAVQELHSRPGKETLAAVARQRAEQFGIDTWVDNNMAIYDRENL